MRYQIMEQRVIKPLQVLMQQPGNIIMGSSRVYHVFDIDRIGNGESFYNMGISSMKLAEEYGFIQGVLHYNWQLKHIYLGLDQGSIVGPQLREGYNDIVANASYPVYGVVSALIGRNAFEAAREIINNPYKGYANIGMNITDSNGNKKAVTYYQGYVKPNGVQYTPKRPDWLVEYGNKTLSQMDTYFTGVETKQAITEGLKILTDIISMTKQYKVKLTLFFPPLSSAMLKWYRDSKYFELYGFFKQSVIAIATENSIPLYDFSRPNTVTESPFSSPDEINQNIYFVDSSHASKLVGDYMMSCFGIKLKVPVTVPDDFCYKAA